MLIYFQSHLLIFEYFLVKVIILKYLDTVRILIIYLSLFFLKSSGRLSHASLSFNQINFFI